MLARKPSKRPRLAEAQGTGGGRHDKQPTLRWIDYVVFSEYEIKGAFPSPYPFDDASVVEAASALASRELSSSPKNKGKGKALHSAPAAANGSVDHVASVGGAAADDMAVDEPQSASASTSILRESVDSTATTSNGKPTPGKKDKQPVSKVRTERLFVCRGCFKYMLYESAYSQHEKVCTFKHPPGRKVYQRGATIIWEVDGSDAKLYCQNLCLFTKLFIEHKYVFYDVDGFMFYILTQGIPSFDYVIGYFSKEKVSYDNYNLACIVTLPMYQKCGWGTLLIEFSYELARRLSDTPGTPERPLSESGRRTYVAFWTSVLVRYFRSAFEVKGEPPPVELAEQAQPTSSSRKTKSTKGWEGEPPVVATAARVDRNGSSFASPARPRRNAAPTKASALTNGGSFEWATTIEGIAEAVNLMPDDVIMAMLDSGMAQCRQEASEGEAGAEDIIVTGELIEEATRRVRYKPRVLDLACVLL